MDFGKTCYREAANLLQTCYREVANLLQTCFGLVVYVADLLWTCYQQNGEVANFLWTCYNGLVTNRMGKVPTFYGLATGKLV